MVRTARYRHEADTVGEFRTFLKEYGVIGLALGLIIGRKVAPARGQRGQAVTLASATCTRRFGMPPCCGLSAIAPASRA